MRMKKLVLAFAIGVFSLAALCGCGGNSDDNGAEATPVVTEAAEDEQQKPVTPIPETTDNGKKDFDSVSLKEAYKDYFDIGIAINTWQLGDEAINKIVKKDFSTFTLENEMKPDYLWDYDATVESKDQMPVIKTEGIETALSLAEELGLKMRGHTLVWHSQTPSWIFYEDYDESKNYVDRDTMLKRMEGYIKAVMTYCKEKHPGVVVAWDVVNEAFSDDPKGGFRTDNPWYEVIGEDYIEMAFTYARKYQEEGSKLILNDYNLLSLSKRNSFFEVASALNEKGLIDGIGMQSHHDMDLSLDDFEKALYKFSELSNLEIQLTELDIHNHDNTDEGFAKQAELYAGIFDTVVRMEKDGFINVSNVTCWGFNDGSSWLTAHRGEESFPLYFDEDYNPKPCYYSILDVASK